MGERVFKRGEVYWFPCDEDAVGHEMQKTRPGLVLSCNSANDRFGTVTIVLMSTSIDGRDPFKVPVRCGGKDGVVCCQEIKSVDGRRLMSFMGTLTKDEMKRVNHCVAACLGMTHMAHLGEPSKEELSEVQKLKVELDITKGMYQEVLRQLIELRVSADIGMNEEIENIDDEIESIEEESVDEPEVEPASFLVEPERTADINTATETELRGVGCTPEISRRIIENRPYESVDELRKFNWMTRMGFQLVKGRLTCTPVVIEKPVVKKPPVEVKPQGKININTARPIEIAEFLGCPKWIVWIVTGYRKNCGKFVSLEELREVPRLPKDFLDKYGEFLTIGEEDPAQEDPEVNEVKEDPAQEDPEVNEVKEDPAQEEPEQRLNINTATTRDFMAVGFGKDVAGRIVDIRKRFGNYKAVDDLAIVDGVTGKILRKLKDVLYVESSGVKPYYTGV